MADVTSNINANLNLNTSDFDKNLQRAESEVDRFAKNVTKKMSDAVKQSTAYTTRLKGNEERYAALKAKYADTPQFKNFQEVMGKNIEERMKTVKSFYANPTIPNKSAAGSFQTFKEAGLTKTDKEIEKEQRAADRARAAEELEREAAAAKKAQEAAAKLASSLARAKTFAAALAKISPFYGMAQALKSLKRPLDNFMHAFGRIITYRVIRGGLTAVLRQWKEGFKNLYGYSVRFSTQFHNTMDSLRTDMQYLGNGFAAMVAPLANAIAPAIQAIADKVVALANAIGYFFAKILGQGSFSAAIRGSAKAFDDMGGSAKEARKQLMGFDELNVLTDNKGGGGKTPADYSKMFEEWSTELEEGSIEQRIREAIENSDWEGLGGLLAEKMNGLVSQFKESNFGKKIGQRIEKGLEIAHGFLKKFDFKEGGAAVAANLNQTIAEIDWYKLGETLNSGITGAFDLILGFIEEFDWHQFSESFSNVIKGWFDHLSDWIASVDWVTFGNTFFDKVYEFITGIDFGGIATSFFTCLGESLVALFGVVEGFLSEMWVKWNEYCGIEAEDSGLDVIGKFLLGIWNALVGIATWVYDNIVAPFFNALRGRDGFGLDGDGGETEQTGKDVIGSFLHRLTVKWEDVKKWVLEKVSWFKTQLGGLKDWLTNKNGTYTWTPSMEWQGKYYAEGGTVPTGQLFIANEAGPELVGTVGGQTTVTSQDQFTAGMADIMEVTNTIILQAAQLVSQTVQNKNMTAVAVIGDREVVSAYDRGKTLAGYALVE